MTPRLFKRKLFRKIQHKIQANNNAQKLDLDNLGKVIIFAPHADDETIGAYTIMQNIPDAFVCVVTDCSTGEGEAVSDFGAVVNRREGEFQKAMSFLNIDKHFFNRTIPNDQLYLHPLKMRNLLNTIKLSDFDTIFMPHQNDNHPDHRSLNQMIKRYLVRQRIRSVNIFGYEVWAPIQAPSNFLPFCSSVDLKKEAIHCYKLQQASVDYAGGVLGLNKYRGIQHNVNYAECFIKEGYGWSGFDIGRRSS
ncbi:MAG: PIG-L family deacetylase [Emcibacteraceae bacterium]|nr:PIG-L family deacetylase [Emcibacteraceae bacterium]